MYDFARNFIDAYSTGQDQRDRRDRRNALMGAGQDYAGGNVTGARNRLLGAGLINEANAYRQMGEQDRAEQYRTRRSEIAREAGGDWRKAAEGLGLAAGEFGDEEGMARWHDQIRGMDAETRQRTAAASDAFGALGVGLLQSGVDPSQWQARALQAAPQIAQRTGLPPEAVAQMIQQHQDWTPDGIKRLVAQNMSAADAMGELTRTQERAQDIQREDSRFNQQIGLQRAQLSLAREARAAAPVNLRGADKSQMDRVNQAAEQARALSTQGEMLLASNARAGTGPGAGVQFWNPDIKSIDQLASTMRGFMRVAGSGATSDYEQRLYARGVPSVDNTREANTEIVRNIQTLAQITTARQYFYQDYAQANGTLMGAERAFQSSPDFQQLTDGGAAPGAAPRTGGGNRIRVQAHELNR